jgi:hypothetical protein
MAASGDKKLKCHVAKVESGGCLLCTNPNPEIQKALKAELEALGGGGGERGGNGSGLRSGGEDRGTTLPTPQLYGRYRAGQLQEKYKRNYFERLQLNRINRNEDDQQTTYEFRKLKSSSKVLNFCWRSIFDYNFELQVEIYLMS